MKKGAWKHEAACKRTEALIGDTVEASKRAGWGNCAQLVLTTLREGKVLSTPLALHFIAVSAKELLSERHDNARLCLVLAMSVADKRLSAVQQHLFGTTFSPLTQKGGRVMTTTTAQTAPGQVLIPPQVAAAVEAVFAKLAKGEMPEGTKQVELAPGLTGYMAQVKLSELNLPPSDPRLN